MVSKMNKEEIKKIFYRFLREESAFTFYFKNLSKDYEDESNEELYYMILHHPTELIKYAFTWRNTPQGQDFWERLHDEWKIIYRKANHFYQTTH